MRSICLLASFLLLFQGLMKAQNPKTNANSSATHPFDKGKWNFDLVRYVGYSHANNYANDVKYGESGRLTFNLGADYMFGKGIGAGLDISADFSKEKTVGENKNRDWMLWANFIYGRPLNDKLSWYVKPSVDYGIEKDIVTPTSGGSNEDEYKTLGFRLVTALPVQLQGGPVYLNPYLSYKRFCIDFEDGEESVNRFGLGFNLMAALRSDEFACDSKLGYRQSNMRYQQGSSYIGFYSRGMYSFGNEQIKYNPSPNEVESRFSTGNLHFDYSYYFINNFYGGVEFKWSNDVSKPGLQPDYEYTNSDFMVIPKLGINLPVKAPLNNFYLELGAGWGSEKFKIDDNGNVNESKDRTSYYGVNLGHNFFIADQVAFTPGIMYSMYKSESTTSTVQQEQERKGFGFRLGARVFLDKF